MDETGGGGRITQVVPHPEVTVTDASMAEKARSSYGEVPALCFIARSVDFPVTHEPVVHVQQD